MTPTGSVVHSALKPLPTKYVVMVLEALIGGVDYTGISKKECLGVIRDWCVTGKHPHMGHDHDGPKRTRILALHRAVSSACQLHSKELRNKAARVDTHGANCAARANRGTSG